jgi:hypothetical protein
VATPRPDAGARRVGTKVTAAGVVVLPRSTISPEGDDWGTAGKVTTAVGTHGREKCSLAYERWSLTTSMAAGPWGQVPGTYVIWTVSTDCLTRLTMRGWTPVFGM